MYADDRVCLTRNHFYLHCERHRLLSTNPRFAPCDFNMLQRRARRLAVKANRMAVYLILALRNPFPIMSVSSGGQGLRGLPYSKWSGKQFNKNSQADALGKCSILDGTAIPYSHHSRRLFWPQSSLKKASHEKDLMGLHHHASSPTTGIVTLSPFVCGMFSGVGGLDARYTGTRQVAARLVS